MEHLVVLPTHHPYLDGDHERGSTAVPRVLLVLGVANLLIPSAHLTYVHFDPINPLPIEILRFLRPA